MSKIYFTTILLPVCISSPAAVSVENYKNTNEVTIKVDREITPEDVVEFNSLLTSIEKDKKVLHMNAVQLNSRGGSAHAARVIGMAIREKKLYTYVAPESVCESACVYILMGGVARYPFGKVGVHRTTFTSDKTVDDSNTEVFVSYDIETTKTYATSVGMSSSLVDAILNTESWRMRYLDDKEKRDWQVMGADRVYEERLFTSIAKDLNISREKYINIFRTNYEDCLIDSSKFEKSVYECSKRRKVKTSYWQFLKAAVSNGWHQYKP